MNLHAWKRTAQIIYGLTAAVVLLLGCLLWGLWY